jgi:pyruvate,water dikinase
MADASSNPALVFPLPGPYDGEADLGPKAAILARLLRAGLPVPQAFCISAEAYREHLQSAPVAAGFQALDAQDSIADRLALLNDLRQAIIECPLSAALLGPIESAYRAMGTDRVAVRSSATTEDLPQHSFAGLYDSFLGIASLPDLFIAIKKCWASLWTDRAFDYRSKNGFDHHKAAMAVIVQELVPAEISGVVFTSDPLSGRHDRLIIESSFGLGEAIVSGKVTPDRMVMSRDGFKVLEHLIAEKALESVSAPAGGVTERPIGGDRSKQPCLDGAIGRRVAALALRIEKMLGSRQDVEWAIAKGEIFILQSRPITTLRERSFEDRQVWSNLNAGEVLPDVASPMTWSLVEYLIKVIFGEIMDMMGLDISGQPLIGRVAGRGYFNLNLFAAIFRSLPGWRRFDPNELFGGAQANVAAEFAALSDEDLPHFRVNRLRLVFKLAALLVWLLSHSTPRGLQFVAALRRRIQALERAARGPLSEEAIVAQVLFPVENFLLDGEAIGFISVGVMYMPQLFTICRRWLGDSDGALANRLLAGLGNMDSAAGGLALWQLASWAHQDPAIERALIGGSDFETTRQSLSALSGGLEFLARWDAFLAQHGHHTRGEVELMNARWRETPDVVLEMIRGFLAGVGRVDPIAVHRQRGRDRRQLTEQCRRRLRNPVKRLIFNFFLKGAQQGFLVRENAKSELVRLLALLRSLLLQLGDKLQHRGVLTRQEDIFFLHFNELEPVQSGRANFDVRAVVADRRAEYQKNLTLTPPAVVVGRYDPNQSIPEVFDATATTFTGVPVSPGLATGPARVILRADRSEQVLPGEILVAPFTDPGWAPHFLQAAAIVMDKGGLLSHGSIIAREYGIPAVVNVGPATRTIQTGQTVHVDGTRGEVRILK